MPCVVGCFRLAPGKEGGSRLTQEAGLKNTDLQYCGGGTRSTGIFE